MKWQKVFSQHSETGFCSESTVYCLRCGVNIKKCLKYSKYSHNHESGCFLKRSKLLFHNCTSMVPEVQVLFILFHLHNKI